MRDVAIRRPVAEYSLGTVDLEDAELWWSHTHSSRRHQPLYGPRDVTLFCREPADVPRGARAFRGAQDLLLPVTKSFSLTVNGHPIFLVDGNWITTDQFLRHANAPQRYLHKLGMLRHAGINAVRVWGGGVAETLRFYDAANLLGMLVYQEFWMTGDNNGRFAGSREWPTDRGAYLANVRDTLIRLRNHPSLFLYAGGMNCTRSPRWIRTLRGKCRGCPLPGISNVA